MKSYLAILFSILILSCTQSQQKSTEKKVGGPCEGCEAIYEFGDQLLDPVDTIPGFDSSKEKMKVTGIIYQEDAKTPANGVILYIYHTNQRGIYQPTDHPEGWELRHGQHRGWIKTGKDGRYTFYTFRPASYPNTTISQHIHATIKAPGYTEYYIDEYLFDDDPFLSESQRNGQRERGGPGGIISLTEADGILLAERDIILGRNIPGY